MIDYDAVMAWPFAPQRKSYRVEDVIATAKGLGTGLPGPLQQADARYLGGDELSVLPMLAVKLADGEFWQRNPKTGIDWKKIVHAGEAITQHRPFPLAGDVVVSQRVVAIRDRGAERGASMVLHQEVANPDGQPYVTIEVTMVLKGDGGFGGTPDDVPRARTVPEDRPADAVLKLLAPAEAEAKIPGFVITEALDVASGKGEGRTMLRGMGIFGLAGRAALALVCGNDPARLSYFGVRYAGPLFCDEKVRVEIWRLGVGRAALRMNAVEREAPVLNHCLIEFVE